VSFEFSGTQPGNVTSLSEVHVLATDEYNAKGVKSIEEGLQLYMKAYRRQFENEQTAERRESSINRFISYLESKGHSLTLADLSFNDGQTFIDTLTNARDGSKLSLATRQDFKSGFFFFTRFLAKSGVISIDIFFDLSI